MLYLSDANLMLFQVRHDDLVAEAERHHRRQELRQHDRSGRRPSGLGGIRYALRQVRRASFGSTIRPA
ncbi:hypothetical protein FE374_11930 [Georgenia yuyongxinii]|uniref:Uncharacterized protein n=1 Tax=Georgenia yuyongxinii TaxID=2589797 RepID=A0A5B8C719_9MICO|nr:hypothetical protein [Georgenia yuyongxinii]QDC25221.1 hypothetical protein FE374_11930 [Georgenia yuyongxinii]